MFIALSARQAKPEHREELIAGFVDQARNSEKNEPGCVSFHVIQDKADPNRIWLYEVFQDEAAFRAHTQMPHTKEFQEKSKDWREEPPTGAALGSFNLWPPDSEWK